MIVPKGWQDWPTATTPVNAAALMSLEQRVSNYVGAVGIVGPGTFDYESFRVKQRIAGANMSVDVGLAGAVNAGYVNVDSAGGVQRYEYAGGQFNVPIAASDPTNPRIDRVVLEAPVNADDSAPRVTVLTGTPSGGATADNLTGAAAVAANRTLLADIVVGAGVSTIVTANIRDRRQDSEQAVPWLLTGRDQVNALPLGTLQTTHGGITVTTFDNMQAAVAIYVPRRVAGATRIRWRYKQGPTPATSNYVLAIADASGRVVAQTTPVAFTGAAASYQERAETITGAAVTFEAGVYFAFFGVAAMTASSSVLFPGVSTQLATGQIGPVARNLVLRSATGGTTVPTTLLAMTDVASLTADTASPPVPQIALSVG